MSASVSSPSLSWQKGTSLDSTTTTGPLFLPIDQVFQEWEICLHKLKQNEALFYQEKLRVQTLRDELQVLKTWIQKNNQEKEWNQQHIKEQEEKWQQQLTRLHQQLEDTRLALTRALEKNEQFEKARLTQAEKYQNWMTRDAEKIGDLKKNLDLLQQKRQREKAQVQAWLDRFKQSLRVYRQNQEKKEKERDHFKRLAQHYHQQSQTLNQEKIFQLQQIQLEKQEKENWKKKCEKEQTQSIALDEKVKGLQEALEQERRAKTLALSYFHRAEAQLSQMMKKNPPTLLKK